MSIVFSNDNVWMVINLVEFCVDKQGYSICISIVIMLCLEDNM